MTDQNRPALTAFWNDHDRAVLAQADALAQADQGLLHALMASNRARQASPRPLGTPPDPLWLDYLERRANVADNVLDAFETVLSRLPVPHAVRADLSPSTARRLHDHNVLDTLNLRLEAFQARARRNGTHPTFGGQDGPSWFGFDRTDVLKRFGKPGSGFRNFDGLFGMWWFQVPDHPWIEPDRLFNVCAGPTGLRAGVLMRPQHEGDRALWRDHDTLSLETVLVAWFHSSVAAALAPTLNNPWLRLTRWSFDPSPTLTPTV